MDNTTLHSEQNDTATVKFNSPKQVLIAARKLIEKPENWTQGKYRRSREDGMSYCSDGALMQADGVLNSGCLSDSYWEACQLLRDNMFGDVVFFNDTHTHAEVLAAFDKAIEAAP